MPETIIDDVTYGSTLLCDNSGGENIHTSGNNDSDSFIDGFDNNGEHAHWEKRRDVGSRSTRATKRCRILHE